MTSLDATMCREHPICQSCIYKHEEHYKDDGFKVKCQGICETDELLPEEITLLYNDEELEMAESLYNPVIWAKRNFDWEPRISKDDIHYQEMMLRCTSRRKALRLGRQCLTEKAELQLLDGTIKSIKDIKAGDKIYSVDTISSSIQEDVVVAQWYSGKKKVYKIKTKFGCEVECTANHPFWAIQDKCDTYHNKTIDTLSRGWLTINTGLKVGDKVATPQALPVFGAKRIHESLPAFLGYFITDGSAAKKQSAKFTNVNEEYLTEFESLSISLGTKVKWYLKGNGYDLIISNGRQSKIVKNPVRDLLYDLGLIGILGPDKFVPDIIFTAPKDQIAIFLNRMWAGDGYISTFQRTGRDTHRTEIGMLQESRRLLEQVQQLLLRFGIHGYIKPEDHSYRLVISNKISVNNFLKNIGPIYGKEQACQKAEDNLAYISDKYIQTEEDLLWDYISSIEEIGEEDTWDIEVAKNHNFISNGYLLKNSGKTEAICVLMLFKAFVNENYKVLVITPYRSQIELIFKRIKELIYMSTDLQNSVRREVANPYHEIEFFNGSYIRGFTSGSKTSQGAGAVRGQPADMIVLDEADYLTTDDINAVVAILNSRPHCELYASSTPTGRRDHFYRWCQEAPYFKEFHFPSYVIPHWNEELEMELRLSLTESGYIHEILAEFGEEEEGVFQVQFRELAEQSYEYADILPDHNRYIFGMGVDWNSSSIGTEIYIVGWDKETKMFVGARAYTVSRIGWTQTAAMEKIKELNRKWEPSFIYVDEGYGATQIEVMKLWSRGQQETKALSHPDCRLGEILKPINFSSNIEIPDPLTNQKVKKDAKSYMIENAVRMFEREIFIFPKTDDTLKKQLAGYIILRRTPTGKPVYGPREERIGDHRLDALMLAFLGYHMEFSDLVKRQFIQKIAFTGNLRGPRKEKPDEGDTVVVGSRKAKENHPRNKLMPEDRSEGVTTIGITGIKREVGKVRDERNLWNWPGFLKDAPPPSKSRSKTYTKRLRPKRGKF